MQWRIYNIIFSKRFNALQQTANLVVDDTDKQHTCAIAEPVLGVKIPHESQGRTGTENQLVGWYALWLKTVEHLRWVAVTVPRLHRAVGAQQDHLFTWQPVVVVQFVEITPVGDGPG